MNLVLRPLASSDLIRQHEYLWKHASPEVADRFLLAADETFAELLMHPHIGSPYSTSSASLARLRTWPVAGFINFRIFYLVQTDLVRIVRILHAKQHPLPQLLQDEEL